MGGDPPRSPRAWLRRIAGRVTIDDIRRATVRARREQRTCNSDDGRASHVAPPDAAESEIDARAGLLEGAWNAIARLPERERFIAIAHYVMGHPPRAVGAMAKVTPRYVSTALDRIRRKLRAQGHVIARAGRGAGPEPEALDEHGRRADDDDSPVAAS